MARVRFSVYINPKIAEAVAMEAERDGVSPNEAIAKIVESHYKNMQFLNSIATVYREIRACRITADALAEKAYGENEWAGFRDAVEMKASDDLKKIFG